ncbi:hypothetical protein INT45_004232 [Circinella minor]|uniref:Uncharacterized protein n=1 Tax=Circinella minor TaxID=1195481 RepID=A0A8H7RVE2_9FUNG|nr:hypothetical protein INT45_004232 [Circinella minor]
MPNPKDIYFGNNTPYYHYEQTYAPVANDPEQLPEAEPIAIGQSQVNEDGLTFNLHQHNNDNTDMADFDFGLPEAPFVGQELETPPTRSVDTTHPVDSIHHVASTIPTVFGIPILGITGDGDDTDNDTDDNYTEEESKDDDSDDMSGIGIDEEEIQGNYIDAWDLEPPLSTNSLIIESVDALLTLEDHECKSYDLYCWV